MSVRDNSCLKANLAVSSTELTCCLFDESDIGPGLSGCGSHGMISSLLFERRDSFCRDSFDHTLIECTNAMGNQLAIFIRQPVEYKLGETNGLITSNILTNCIY
jgi:hypothetical protein